MKKYNQIPLFFYTLEFTFLPLLYQALIFLCACRHMGEIRFVIGIFHVANTGAMFCWQFIQYEYMTKRRFHNHHDYCSINANLDIAPLTWPFGLVEFLMNQLSKKLKLLGEDTLLVLYYISNMFLHARAHWP